MGNMRQVYDRNRRDHCGCMPSDCNKQSENLNTPYVEKMALAMAYVPWQEWNCVYDANQGLQAGTIFPELDKPWYGQQCGPRRGERC